MSKKSVSGGQKRLAILVGLTVTVLISWLLLRGPGVELVSEEFAAAEVIEVVRDDVAPAKRESTLAIAVVELSDGGRARIFAPRARVVVGGTVQIKVKRYSDGSRHVIGKYHDEPSTIDPPN